MSEFMSLYNSRNLVKEKKIFKNPKNPSCTDHILTNSLQSFQNSTIFKTGIPDFHKLATIVLKQYFLKLKPKVVNSRDYRKFCNDEFRAKCDIKRDIKTWYKQHGIPTFP